MTEANQITGIIDGTEFSIESVEYSRELHTTEAAKEYELVHFPDEYGGVTIPVPVDPYDTEHVVTGQTTEGRLVAGDGFPHDSVPYGTLVDIDIEGSEHITRACGAVLVDYIGDETLQAELLFADYETGDEE